MFRAMRKAPDNLPEAGRSARTLGVRVAPPAAVPEDPPKFDVYPDANGDVDPRRGMSVALDDPRGLPKHRRPASMGGEGRDPVFSLLASQLGPGLKVYEDDAPHAVVEPAQRMSLVKYETALTATRPSWRPYDV